MAVELLCCFSIIFLNLLIGFVSFVFRVGSAPYFSFVFVSFCWLVYLRVVTLVPCQLLEDTGCPFVKS